MSWDAWYRSHAMRQKDLASALELSPQALAELLSLRNRPTGEQALRIAEFLETETMKSELVDPPTFPAERTRDPNEPQTLHQAKEMIDALRAELKSKPPAAIAITPAPTKPAGTPAPLATQPTPAPKPAVELPAASSVAMATTALTAWDREVLRAHQAATADLSSEPLEKQSISQLRSALNAEKDPTVRAAIYRQLTARKEEAAALSRGRPKQRSAAAGPTPNPPPDQAPASGERPSRFQEDGSGTSGGSESTVGVSGHSV
jgi:hypothetical protein